MLHLVLHTQRHSGFVLRTVVLQKNNSKAATQLTYKIFGDHVPEAPMAMDGFVFAVILHAMTVGAPLYVHGPVTRRALYNLEEFQLAWSLWRPQLYRHIEIIPDSVIDPVPSPPYKALCAFSGGLDSTFTALRHRLKLAGNGSYDLDTVVMVQGFDIGFDNNDYFLKALDRARPFLEHLSLDVRLVATHREDPLFQDWEDSHGAELACCLHQFVGEFRYGLIGSTKPYDGLVLPYGSNPATDHLFSGDGFIIVHDGSGFSRTAKAELVAKYPFALAQLRVCYAGKLQYKNCGKCEKCMRTYLNFLAAGETAPACFDRLPDMAQVSRIRTQNEAQRAELVSIVMHARKKGIEAAWLSDLEQSIQACKPSSQLSRMATKVSVGMRRKLGKALAQVGLKRPIKAALHWLYERTA